MNLENPVQINGKKRAEFVFKLLIRVIQWTVAHLISPVVALGEG